MADHRERPVRSQARQRELTEILGRQVRRASEVLVDALSRANRRTDGELLRDQDGPAVYEAVTSLLMRSVVLLVAEERGMLPVGHDGPDTSPCALSTLLADLEQDEDRNRSAMRRRSGAWARLLALTRLAPEGSSTVGLDGLGGAPFAPHRHPFLEGRVADGGQGERQPDIGVVDDVTVLTVLRLLQVDGGQGVSVGSLGVEQVGHVYEALLDHTAVVVRPDEEVVLGLRGRGGLGPDVSLADLERWRARGRKQFARTLVDAGVARDAKAAHALLDTELPPDDPVAATLHAALGGRGDLVERVRPFAGLIRPDARGIATIFLPGDVHVTAASERSDTGTYYTPTDLIEEILDAALEPTIDEVLRASGPDAEAQEAALLALTVCDPACGTGHFLVGAARRLAGHLARARSDTPDREDHRIAMRDVVTRCLYGADLNPQAVELAKLSLWLESHVPGRPAAFLDHRFVVGDSLVGAWTEELRGDLPRAAFAATANDHTPTATAWKRVADARAAGQATPVAGDADVDLTGVRAQAARYAAASDSTLDAVRDKAQLVERVRSSPELQRARALADLWCGVFVSSKEPGTTPDVVEAYYDLRAGATPRPAPEPDRRFVHWEIAFPELERDADGALFDVVIGNPPYVRGREHAQVDPRGRAFASFRWAPCRGSTWNLYVPFILLAASLARHRSAMLVQSSVLGAQFAGAVHRELMATYGVEAVLDFSGVPHLFHGAAVQVASIVVTPETRERTTFRRYGPGLAPEVEVEITEEDLRRLPDGYWTLPTSGLPPELIEVFLGAQLRLGDVATITDGMEQTAAYDVRPLVRERSGFGDEVQLTPTGLIDPFVSLWGTRPVTYLKSRYDHPVVRTSELRQHGFADMADQAEATKIGVAGLSKRVEAVVDEGHALISKSAYVIRLGPDEGICPYAVCALLNSRVVNQLYDAAYGALGFGAGSKNYRPPTLGGLPLPDRRWLRPSSDPDTLSGFGRAAHAAGSYDEEELDQRARRALLAVTEVGAS